MASPILTVAQMRDWEQATWQSSKITEQEVIARVGKRVADRAVALTGEGDRILLVAGKGHNGDDVRMSRQHLTGRSVELLDVSDPTHQLPELANALDRRPALIVDGLFGIGLNRPLDEDWKVFIERINRSGSRVLAVDSPSGLNCETGQPEGCAVIAERTMTLGAVKRGLIAPAAARYVGELELESDIGLVPCPTEGELMWTSPDDFAEYPPRRKRDAHKGSFGHLVIVAGSLGYHGAAVLATRGALAARPGLITLVTTDECYPPIAAQLQSSMVRPWASDWELPEKTTAVLFGPGLADPTVPTGLRKQMLHLWQEFEGAVVVDASGLDWLTADGLTSKGCRLVTPHPGEAARMLGASVNQIQADRPIAVRKISEKFGDGVVVLKGYQSMVGQATGPIFVNNSGGPLLGQGGSGDVLAGYLAGLLAQPELVRDPVKAIRFGVWRHGRAGESRAWDGLIENLPPVLARPIDNEIPEQRA